MGKPSRFFQPMRSFALLSLLGLMSATPMTAIGTIVKPVTSYQVDSLGKDLSLRAPANIPESVIQDVKRRMQGIPHAHGNHSILVLKPDPSLFLNTIKDFGHPDCPCYLGDLQIHRQYFEFDVDDPMTVLMYKSYGIFDRLGINSLQEAVIRRHEMFDTLINTLTFLTITGYGYGCKAHDEFMTFCQPENCLIGSNSIGPAVDNCDQGFCSRSWCIVDPNNCGIKHHASTFEPHIYRSYATCDEASQLSGLIKFSTIVGKVYRAGFVSSTGGWKKAYHQKDTHFSSDMSEWTGPMVRFAFQSAMEGRYQMNLTFVANQYLINASLAYYQADSPFDLCLYAVQLGFLDFCVGGFTITSRRASQVQWLNLYTQPLELMVEDSEQRNAAEFWGTFGQVFQPFSLDVWMFIFFFVLPITGILMLFHDYGVHGSAFPFTQPFLRIYPDGRTEKFERKIPIFTYFLHSYYSNFLSLFEVGLNTVFVNIGSKLTLLGFYFFVFMFAALYTANLAAILAQGVVNPTITSFDEVIANNYRICVERSRVNLITSRYPNFNPENFVRGLDGELGFIATNTLSATLRVLNQVNYQLALEGDLKFCHAAVIGDEDLLAAQANGNHCNKLIVGDPVANEEVGFPVADAVASDLIPFFLRMRKQGNFYRELTNARPQAACQAGNATPALGIYELVGVWMFTGFFVGLAILMKLWLGFKRVLESLGDQKPKSRHAIKRDQHFEEVDVYEQHNWESDWVECRDRVMGESRHSLSDQPHVMRGESVSFLERFSPGPARFLHRQIDLDAQSDLDESPEPSN